MFIGFVLSSLTAVSVAAAASMMWVPPKPYCKLLVEYIKIELLKFEVLARWGLLSALIAIAGDFSFFNEAIGAEVFHRKGIKASAVEPSPGLPTSNQSS